MPETIRYKSPEELKEEEIERKIKERGPEGEILGGIVFEEEIDPETGKKRRFIYIGNPYEERPLIIKLETDATKEDIEAIKKEIIPMRECFKILEAMARTYSLRQPLLIEGPTAIGKTFLVEKFTELLYGRGVKPLDFYCSGQTDVSELMAKWVPRVETEEEKRKWNEFLELAETQIKIAQIAQEVEEKTYLSREQKLVLIHTKLQELAKEAGLSEKTQWRLQYGAVPKAMGLIRNPDGSWGWDPEKGTGFTLHIQEVGLAEPQVANILLKLGGKGGQLAKEIQLWENGGEIIRAGPKFWVVFSTNPPEEYLGRNPIDPALARRLVNVRVEELSEESLHLAAEYYFTYKVGEKPTKKPERCILDIYNHPEIGKEIAKIVASFHNDLSKELKKGEKGRIERTPLSLDEMSRVAQALIFHQIRNPETGLLDLAETLKKHIDLYYLARLADKDLKETMERNLEEILTGDTGKVKFEGKIMTRKEMLDILVERASMTEEEKIRQEEQKEEEERRKLLQGLYNAQDKIEKVLRIESLPEEVREILEKKLKEIEDKISKNSKVKIPYYYARIN